MRTTLNLDEEALEAVKSYAGNCEMSMGKAASELIKRGRAYRCPTRWENGFLVFAPPPGSVPKLTHKMVRRLLEEEDA
ncbi:MAG TPA: hypothetical protein VH639_27585 [Bryobacteraceae bacterium]|jgi:hypothetical protein